eukprot:6214815-Pleurochrysis_carterae.AAC.5
MSTRSPSSLYRPPATRPIVHEGSHAHTRALARTHTHAHSHTYQRHDIYRLQHTDVLIFPPLTRHASVQQARTRDGVADDCLVLEQLARAHHH